MDKPVPEMDNSVPEKKKKRGCLIVLIIFLVLIISVLIVASVFISRLLGQIEREEEVVETLSQEEIDLIFNETDPVEDFLDETETVAVTEETEAEEEVTTPSNPVEAVVTGDNVINILLVGQDTYSTKRRSRTDTMILCTINKEEKTLTLTSFMRDLYVKIPGYADQRLNVPYVLGGFKKLYQTLEHNFGVEVDYGIAVNFSSFIKVIQLLDGVEIELTSAEAKYMNKRHDGWNLKEGVTRLDPEQALMYARIRKIDSDFKRTSRQRKLLSSVLNEAKEMSLTELYELVELLVPMVKTDMTDAEIVSMAFDLAPLLMDMEIKTQRIPISGEYKSKTIKGMSVIVADAKANRKFLQETIGENED